MLVQTSRDVLALCQAPGCVLGRGRVWDDVGELGIVVSAGAGSC